ncbi:MAG: DUF4149 domain-containing protein [Acidobacteriaceae bacterium]|nr:DUF4149 domain-containing protein [Acidobacteriaceae bacterium]
MAFLFRIFRLLALSVWVGSIVFFIAGVTVVAFRTMPDAHHAGIIVRGTLLALHRIGLISGAVYLLFTLALLATQKDTHPARAVELALVVSMMALTAYSQFSVIPRMEADRIAVGGDIAKAEPEAPQVAHFNRLHGLSVKLEGAVLLEGLLLIVFAAVHGHDEYDRLA